MPITPRTMPLLALSALLLLPACANDGATPFGGLTTASTEAEAPRVSPACVAINARIEALRKEGVTDRAAQAAASGKSATVQVKRTSLQQLAELDKANAEFQAKCSTLGPRTASAPPAQPALAKAAAAPDTQAHKAPRVVPQKATSPEATSN